MGIQSAVGAVHRFVVGLSAWATVAGSVPALLTAGVWALWSRMDNVSWLIDAALIITSPILIFASVYFFNRALPPRRGDEYDPGDHFSKLRIVNQGPEDVGLPEALWAPRSDILPGSATLEYQEYDENGRQWTGRTTVPLNDSGRWRYALFGGYRAPLFRRGEDRALLWGADGPAVRPGQSRGVVTVTPVSGVPARRLFSLTISDDSEVIITTDDLFEFIDEWAEEDRLRAKVA